MQNLSARAQGVVEMYSLDLFWEDLVNTKGTGTPVYVAVQVRHLFGMRKLDDIVKYYQGLGLAWVPMR